MILKIAWKNIWRNKVRSLVVIISVALGIWAGLFTMGVSEGMNNARIRDAVQTYLSDMQIHAPSYKKEAKWAHAIPNAAQVMQQLEKQPQIAHAATFAFTTAMATSASGAEGVQLEGVNAAPFDSISSLPEQMVEGTFLPGKHHHELVIGKKLAEKLKVRIRSKVIFTFQDKQHNMVSAAFRVSGIFETSSSRYDQSVVFVKQEELQRLVGSNVVHEIRIMTKPKAEPAQVSAAVQPLFPKLVVEPWNKVSPELGYANEVMMESLLIFIGIILFAMAFGVLNTMLMAVLERKRELGMLMAIGMNKWKVFRLIMWETLFLSMVAAPLGMGIAIWMNTHFHEAGLDLSMMAEGMKSMGMDAVIYTELETSLYFIVGGMVIVMAMLSAIYPAIKALSLKPTETMRTI